MGKLELSPYRGALLDLEPGETLRVNHDGCEAGEDVRRRLYLTRPGSDPTNVIGYCHNCQTGGVLRTGSYMNYRDRKHHQPLRGPSVLKMEDLAPPNHMIQDIMLWPTHATAWALKGKLSSTLCQTYNIQFDPSSNRVYLPRYKSFAASAPLGGELKGYQLRNTDPGLRVPKYLTVATDDDRGYSIIYGKVVSTVEPTIIVLVEDLLSGITVVEAFEQAQRTVHAMVNYGTKVNLEAVHHCSRYDNTLVWLDNDSPHVIDQAKVMARTIQLLHPGAQVVSELREKDPKHYDYITLRKIVLDATSWL